MKPVKKASLNIQVSDKVYQQIVEIAEEGVWFAKPDGTTIYVNKKMANMLGYSQDEIIGREGKDFLANRQDENVAKARQELAKSKKIVSEYEFRKKDGTTIWTIGKTAPVFSEKGQHLANVAMHTDITQRKKTEEALKQSEDQMRAIVETSMFEVSVSTLDGVMIFINEAYANAFGYPKNELIGFHTPNLYVDQKDREKLIETLSRQGFVKNFETQVRRKDGTTFWVAASIAIVNYGGQKAVLGVSSNITERKKAEEALRESEAKFSNAFSSSPAVLAIVRISDNSIIDVNETFLQLTGYNRKEVVGHTSEELRLFPDIGDRDSTIAVVIQQGSIRNHEMDVRTKTEKLLRVIASLQIIEINAQKHLLATMIDITERKKAQKALEESEQIYRTLFDNSADGFELLEVLFDDRRNPVDWIFLKVNQAFELQTGLKETDVLGKKAKQVIPNIESYWINTLGRVERTGKSEHIVNYNQDTARWYDDFIFKYKGGQVGVLFRDITERKKAEGALKKSEERYRTLFSSIGEAFALHEMLFDSQGVPCDYRFLEVNGAFEKQTGLKASEIIGKTVWEVLPDLEPFWIEIYGKVVTTGEPARFESYNRSLKKYFEVYAFRPFQGKFASIFTDISERKKVEQIIKEKDAELNCILDSSPTIIFYKDKEGKVIQANNAFAQALNVSKENLLGKTVFDLYSPEIAQQMTNDDLAVMKSKKPKIGTIEPYESPTGLRWLRTDKIPSFDEKGEVDGIIGFSEDITERKKAEEEVARLASFPQFNPLPIVEADFVGNITYSNPAATNLFAELKILDSTNPFLADWQNIIDIFSSKRLDAFSREIEVCERWYYEFFYIVPKSQLIRLYAEDITERKKLEKQVTDSQQLAAIGATAGMVGHDIRNPLQAVMSDTYLLKNELASMPECENKEGVTESIDSIERNVAYINKIVQDLQDYAKQVVPEYSIVDLSEVFVRVFETISVPESIKLSVNVKDAEKIRIDPTLLQRAITNLVNNAIQAMADGGKLEICGEKADGRIKVTVSDTGVGIPEEIKPKLFTPMLTTKAKGQGFGLAASKRMIEAMKGTINFESEMGKGAKFIIELPAGD